MIIFDEKKAADRLEVGDTAETLRFITQDTRGNLVQDILGHPEVSPSFDELVYVNPSKSRATIREHLRRLKDSGIIKKVKLPRESRTRDNPHTFYVLTEPGIAFLSEHNLFLDEIEQIRTDYESVEKPDRIREIENIERPEQTEESKILIKEYTD